MHDTMRNIVGCLYTMTIINALRQSQRWAPIQIQASSCFDFPSNYRSENRNNGER
mgnify:FL=1